MNKTALKNFSINARKKLIEDIKQKAYELGITENQIKEIETFEGGFKVKGTDIKRTIKYYSPEKVDRIIVEKRNDLIDKINYKGFDQVIEEVAYTWFNRFIALRFMEANDYLPTGVRVLSSEDETIEPDIIKEALNIDLDIDREIIYNLQDNNETDDLYKYLLIKQCNKLGEIMPTVFEEIADYTELLIPDKLFAEGSIIRDLVESIDEEDYKEQVEIIGWMYQYYISEKKDEVFAGLKKNKKITKENIPAATQLFTPKWIVKYMVENSLGRLWLESHPDEELQKEWKYYLEEAEQDAEVQEKLDELKDPNLNPEDIKVLDNAMGSGHILSYCFDVLYDIYLKAGYPERRIPQLILEKNLYGLDIDDRSAQLATFALLMKARSKNRRIFRKEVDVNLCSIQESNGISKEAVEYFANGDKDIKRDIRYLVDIFNDAKEYGSILDIKQVNFIQLEERLEKIRKNEALDLFQLQYKREIVEILPLLIKQARIMSDKYSVVCANPPYAGSKNLNPNILKYMKKYYPNAKRDLYSVFIEKCTAMTSIKGYTALITMQSWMFLSSFKKLRKGLLKSNNITSMAHLGAGAFDELSAFNVITTAVCFRKIKVKHYKSVYIRLVKYHNSREKINQFFNKLNYYTTEKEKFYKLPNDTILYWISDRVSNIFFSCKKVKDIARPKQGMATSDNARFLRKWQEVDFTKIGFCCADRKEALESGKKWFPYNKGGDFRKWYGNNEYLVNWENDGQEIKEFREYKNKTLASNMGVAGLNDIFREGITYSLFGFENFGVRYKTKGYIFDVSGASLFPNHDKSYYLLGFLASNVAFSFLSIIAPTVNFQAGNIGDIPFIYDERKKSYINKLVKENIQISKVDWDINEYSWDFAIHPYIKYKQDNKHIKNIIKNWNEILENNYINLKNNEEELNNIFISIFGLEEELTHNVRDRDIAINRIDNERDIKSFISYAVGCMFGRYSLDEEGLVYAAGEFDINRYSKIKPVEDNIIPITTDDYFEDDIVSRFVKFVSVTFGEESLEENLEYIAETIGKKSSETSRQAIRNYFLKKSGFYKDHVRTYSKTPIYWMFDSGKQDGFKALIYMHRYDPLLVARVRTDYLHELQGRYEAEINRLDTVINSDTAQTREKSQARKQRDKVSKQLEECRKYDQVINHMANRRIDIDLDDGVKVNYTKFQKVEVPMGEGKKPLKEDLLAKL